MKTLLSFLFLFTIISTCTAQYTELIKDDAEKFNKAYLSRDYDTFIDYLIPAVVALGGGPELMKNVAIETAAANTESGMIPKSIIPESIGKVYELDSILHTVIGQQVTIMLGDNKYVKTAYYLAESVDQGNSWTFLDLEPYDTESLHLFIPRLSMEIEIPEVEELLMVKE